MAVLRFSYGLRIGEGKLGKSVSESYFQVQTTHVPRTEKTCLLSLGLSKTHSVFRSKFSQNIFESLHQDAQTPIRQPIILAPAVRESRSDLIWVNTQEGI
jgi:hypothetical protein